MFKEILLLGIFAFSYGQTNASGAGPWLNFISPGKDNTEWKLSALVVTPSSSSEGSAPPHLTISSDSGSKTFQAKFIDHLPGNNLWRYDLDLNRTVTDYTATYSIGSNGKKYKTYIPASRTDPHVFFGSCNKQEKSVTMWEKLVERHTQRPYGLAFLAGDQIYNDAIFNLESVKQGMSTNANNPLTAQLKEEITVEATNFLTNHYITHYSRPDFSTFLASVPTKSLADDHEYFNGVGSYTEVLPVLDLLKDITERFYFLFQHHTLKQGAAETGLIVSSLGSPFASYNFLLKFETTAYFGLDTRTERTPKQVCSEVTREWMYRKLDSIPSNNIFLITGIPFVDKADPTLYKITKFLNRFEWVKTLILKIANEPASRVKLDISAEFVDPWTYEGHLTERNEILSTLNKIAVKGKKTLTLLGGDVHYAAAGEVIDSETKEVRLRQLTSSGITSVPLPRAYAWVKNLLSSTKKVKSISDGLEQRLTGYRNVATGKVEQELLLYNALDITVDKGQVFPLLLTLETSSSNGNSPLEEWVPTGWPSLEDISPIQVVS